MAEVAQCGLNLAIAVFAIVTAGIDRRQDALLKELERQLRNCEQQGRCGANRLDG